MIVWKGYGVLGLVLAIAIGVLGGSVFHEIGLAPGLGAAIGELIAGVVIWFVGNRFNSPAKGRVLIDKQTGREFLIKPDHSLFFIKMQYWAFIVGGFGLIMLIDVLAHHGKSSF